MRADRTLPPLTRETALRRAWPARGRTFASSPASSRPRSATASMPSAAAAAAAAAGGRTATLGATATARVRRAAHARGSGHGSRWQPGRDRGPSCAGRLGGPAGGGSGGSGRVRVRHGGRRRPLLLRRRP